MLLCIKPLDAKRQHGDCRIHGARNTRLKRILRLCSWRLRSRSFIVHFHCRQKTFPQCHSEWSSLLYAHHRPYLLLADPFKRVWTHIFHRVQRSFHEDGLHWSLGKAFDRWHNDPSLDPGSDPNENWRVKRIYTPQSSISAKNLRTGSLRRAVNWNASPKELLKPCKCLRDATKIWTPAWWLEAQIKSLN